MAEDDATLRQLLISSMPEFEQIDGAALRRAADRSAEGRPRVRLFGVPAAVTGVIVMIAATAITVSLIAHRSRSAGNDRGGAGDGFRVQLVLPAKQFPAGGKPINAYVLAINNTGRSITISNACNGWVQAGLTGKDVTFEIGSAQVACASDTLPPGTTRLPLSIPTTYVQCQQGRRQGSPELPHCVGPTDSQLPNLPPGPYFAELGTMSTSIRPDLSSPQLITLTPGY